MRKLSRRHHHWVCVCSNRKTFDRNEQTKVSDIGVKVWPEYVCVCVCIPPTRATRQGFWTTAKERELKGKAYHSSVGRNSEREREGAANGIDVTGLNVESIIDEKEKHCVCAHNSFSHLNERRTNEKKIRYAWKSTQSMNWKLRIRPVKHLHIWMNKRTSEGESIVQKILKNWNLSCIPYTDH